MNKEEQINVIIRKAVQIFNEDTLKEKLKLNLKIMWADFKNLALCFAITVRSTTLFIQAK